MIDQWQYYKKRAVAFLEKSVAVREHGDEKTSDAYLLVVAENLLRAAKTAPTPLGDALAAQAEEIVAVLENPASISAANGDEKGNAKPWQDIIETGVSFADVAGLEEAKRLTYNMVIRPLLDPEGAKRWRKKIGGGLLLYGPPGNGKTLFAKAIANELEAVFLNVVGSSLLTKWVGDAEKNVAGLFDEATRHRRCVLFIDEVEALLPTGGQGSTVMDRVVPTFLSAMDGVVGRDDGLLLLGATNRPEDLDKAALRRNRFEHQVYIGLPDRNACLQILEQCLNGIPLHKDVRIADFAERFDGYSGADIASLCDVAIDIAWDREEEGGSVVQLSMADLNLARQQVRPSVSPKDLEMYKKFKP